MVMVMMKPMTVVVYTAFFLFALDLPVTLAYVLTPVRNLEPSNNTSSSPPTSSLHHHQQQQHHLDQSLAPLSSGTQTSSSTFLNCVSGRPEMAAILETSSHHHSPHFLVNISADFRYLQVSMKLGACYNHSIYRGNRFLTREEEGLGQVHEGSQVTLEVVYERSTDGSHAYRLIIESLDFRQTISTKLNCGEFQGFRVKVNGASVCELHWQENTLGVRVVGAQGSSPPSLSLSPFSSLYNLQRWASGAYVMAICFTLTSYLLYLVASRCQSKSPEYTIVVAERNV